MTAVDLSRRSVAAARLNARLHRRRVTVHRGDLFAPVSDVVPVPSFVTVPVPEMALETVWAFDRLKARLALLITAPVPS